MVSNTAKRKRGRPRKSSSAAKITDNKKNVVEYPAAGKKVTEFEAKLDRDLATAEPEKEQQDQLRPIAVETGLPDEIVKQAVKLPFDLWSISQDVERLKLKEDEAQLLTPPLKKLLDYYTPRMSPITVAWASLGLGLYSIMSERLKLIADLKKQKRQTAQPEGNPKPGMPINGVMGMKPAVGTPPADQVTPAGQNFPTPEQAQSQQKQKI